MTFITLINIPQTILLGIIRAYQRVLSPLTGHSCRFSPTCSHYALGAIQKFGAIKGGYLVARRLMRCHPWGGPGGCDPVPHRTDD